VPNDTLRERVETRPDIRILRIHIRDPALAANPEVRGWVDNAERALTTAVEAEIERVRRRLLERKAG
jgi:hypothetical protein